MFRGMQMPIRVQEQQDEGRFALTEAQRLALLKWGRICKAKGVRVLMVPRGGSIRFEEIPTTKAETV